MTDDRWPQREESSPDDDPLLDPRAAAGPLRDVSPPWAGVVMRGAPGAARRYPPPLPEDVEPEFEPPPRVWSALLAPFIAAFVAFVATVVVLFAISFVVAVQSRTAGRPMPSSDAELFREHPMAFLLLLLPAQLVFVCVALAATVRSSVPLEQRLSLMRGSMPPWTWGVLMAASPFMGWLGGLMAEQIGGYEELMEPVRAVAQSGPFGFAMTVAVIAAAAGVGEELLFRGYVQTRLLQRWPAALAILVSAGLFALMHILPAHMLGVIPLGIWLGVVAWRTQSVYPAMLCHGVNNLAAIIALVWLDPYEQQAFGPAMWLLLITILAFLWSLVLLKRGGEAPGLSTAEP